MEIGAHVPSADPLGEAAQRNADIVQVFLSNPQQWKAPKERDDAAELAGADVGIYVHAPYLINVVSPNNRVRIPSRKSLQQTCEAAASVGARKQACHCSGQKTHDDARGEKRNRSFLHVAFSTRATVSRGDDAWMFGWQLAQLLPM